MNADGLSGMGLYHVEHMICDTFRLSLTNVMGAATDRLTSCHERPPRASRLGVATR